MPRIVANIRARVEASSYASMREYGKPPITSTKITGNLGLKEPVIEARRGDIGGSLSSHGSPLAGLQSTLA